MRIILTLTKIKILYDLKSRISTESSISQENAVAPAPKQPEPKAAPTPPPVVMTIGPPKEEKDAEIKKKEASPPVNNNDDESTVTPAKTDVSAGDYHDLLRGHIQGAQSVLAPGLG